MRIVNVKDAVGMVLAHDITQIVPGKVKDAAFRKGHVVRPEDIPRLLDLGKEHLYIWEAKEGWFHEDEAASTIAEAVAGQGMEFSSPKEGKINFIALYDGLLKVDTDKLEAVNSVDQVVLSTLHNNRPVAKGEVVAGTRVIPLVIEEEKIREVQDLGRSGPVVEVKKLLPRKVGIVTTGSEVFHGRIKDGFGPALTAKMDHYHCPVITQIIVDDNPENIKRAIRQVKEQGAELILVTGGMSVDPDDVTPASIRDLGATIISYGAPVLPGAMFLLSYWEGMPLLGLPGCVMYSKQTVFDLVFPRVLAGETLTKKDIVRLGHGGMCEGCKDCRYPSCSFGRG